MDALRRQAPQPLVKRDVLENGTGEHLKESRVGVPSVLDIMPGVGGYIADVVWVEVNRGGVVDREKDSHASLAGDPELPLRGVRMPMQLAHPAGLERDQGCSNLGEGEVAGIDDPHLA